MLTLTALISTCSFSLFPQLMCALCLNNQVCWPVLHLFCHCCCCPCSSIPHMCDYCSNKMNVSISVHACVFQCIDTHVCAFWFLYTLWWEYNRNMLCSSGVDPRSQSELVAVDWCVEPTQSIYPQSQYTCFQTPWTPSWVECVCPARLQRENILMLWLIFNFCGFWAFM